MDCSYLSDAVGDVEIEEDLPAATQNEGDSMAHSKRKEQAALEGRQSFELWRSIRHVVNLYVNVRALGVLARFQAEMRSGKIQMKCGRFTHPVSWFQTTVCSMAPIETDLSWTI